MKKLLLSSLLAVSLLGCDSSGGTAVLMFDSANFNGTYTGTWTNTTFASTGAASVTISENSGMLSVAVDLDGNVFGGANPASETFMATINTNDATIGTAVTSTVYGDVTATLGGNGTLTISGINIPGSVDTFSLTGSIVNGQIQANVTITFDAGGSAAATATLTTV